MADSYAVLSAQLCISPHLREMLRTAVASMSTAYLCMLAFGMQWQDYPHQPNSCCHVRHVTHGVSSSIAALDASQTRPASIMHHSMTVQPSMAHLLLVIEL